MILNQVYNMDCLEGLKNIQNNEIVIVTDPPYNVNYHYDEYKDNKTEEEYLKILGNVFKQRKCVIIHYPETLYKISVSMGVAPMRVVSWCYNSNTPRQHRDIAFFGINPDFTKVSQPYKNLNDKRIQERIKEGKSCKMYDWFTEEQIKNVEKSRLSINHPCVIPLSVMDRIIKLLPQNLIICDPFCGSGTTLIAAKKNKRNFIGFEISKNYFELAKRRLSEETSQLSLF